MNEVNTVSFWVLLLSTASIAMVHSLAPDHWVPFVSMARARNWTRSRLLWVTLLSGIGHVGSSIVIGGIGLALGFSLNKLQLFESQRAAIAGWLLIGFGLAYAIWGIKHVRQHKNIEEKISMGIWTLVAIFVLGPCEPLIPLMFIAIAHGWQVVALTCGVFSILTISMMVGQTWLGYRGVSLIKSSNLECYSHVLAGLVIVATGGLVVYFGI
ncbi:MAG: hypothetical protein D6813_03005 [Calditrichaeota bacterium]|nr:MAG: hypothetical protein D6813_03005 [Calditrichota bacterium]